MRGEVAWVKGGINVGIGGKFDLIGPEKWSNIGCGMKCGIGAM